MKILILVQEVTTMITVKTKYIIREPISGITPERVVYNLYWYTFTLQLYDYFFTFFLSQGLFLQLPNKFKEWY